ncbi:MAG TPA: hypothetical protein VFW44_20800 [Bryobacteraceae bacterium]|nr:hypothetical protein [Bryobacteraceae bacterium]
MKIRQVLRTVKESVVSIHQQRDSGYDASEEPKLILVCALAAGTDQLVARIALEEGYRLHVPIAFPRDEYMARNFGSPQLQEAREAFDKLYGIAESRMELDGGESETEAYDIAGTVLVSHSDLLLAVWDLGPGKGPGGTADSVRKALEAGIPVVKFDATSPAEPVLDYRQGAALPLQDLKPLLRDILQQGLRPPHDLSAQDFEQTVDQYKEERESLERFLGEPEKRMDWSGPYNIVIGLLALKLPRLKFRLAPYSDAVRKSWAPVPDARPDCARGFFQPLDLWPDSLAVYYANWMRGIVALSLILGSIIVDYVLAARLWNNAFPSWIETATAAAAPLMALLIWLANHRDVHRRWLQYRMLSENLRNAALALAIGASPRRPKAYETWQDFAPSWVAFYTQACVRGFGLGSASLNADYLSDYRALLADRVKGQFKYHRRRSALCNVLNRHVRRLVFAAFLITFLGAMLHIFHTLVHGQMREHVGEALVENVIKVSLEFTVLSAAIAALAAQEGFAKLAQASANTAIHLNQLAANIENAPLSGAAIRQQAERATEELRREHEDWYLLYSLREIEYS